MKKEYYCENCLDDDPRRVYEDNYGTVFCGKKCLVESQEYRDVDVSRLKLKRLKR